jgi:hypothetical protein
MKILKKNSNATASGFKWGVLFSVFISLLNCPAHAQSDSSGVVPQKLWKIEGSFMINYNQSSFTNWVAGGNNQMGLASILKPSLRFDNGKWSWETNLDLRYGLQKNGSDKARKSDDVLRMGSKLGRQISKNWEFSGLYMLNTQLSASFDRDQQNRLLTTIMAPGYTNLSLGFNYSPDDKLSIYLTPINLRSTYVLNDSLSQAGEFEVVPGDRVHRRFGPAALIGYKDELFKNVIVDTKFGYFQDALDGFGDPVVNWDTILSLKVNKYLSTTLTFALFYDEQSKIDEKDEDGNVVGKVAKLQFKETLGVGFNVQW